MRLHAFVAAAVGLLVSISTLAAQRAPASDLDVLMERVLARRDDNWKKLQQYVLNETETFQLIGPGGRPLYGFRREYLWFPRDGRFIKSPLTADGVAIDEEERRREEERWLRREERRERREAEKARRERGQQDTRPDEPETAAALTEASLRDTIEPGFVSAAYFLKFKFDPGQYAFAGRERFAERDVLRVEYYPTLLFREGRTRPNKEMRKRDDDIEMKMNKVAIVTLWVDPAEHQILKYHFQNIDMDFLPGRSLIRADGIDAVMEMGQPFPGVWLPQSIRIGLDFTLAVGEVDGRYSTEFHDYRLASVTTRVR